MTISPFTAFEKNPNFDKAVKLKLIECIAAINAGAAGGEVNDGANLGTGQGIFASKSGVDLQFKSLRAGANITLSASGTEITINSSGGGGGGNSYFPGGW